MNKKGIILIISFMVIVVLLILGFTIIYRAIVSNNATIRFSKSTRAFWLAEAGIQRGLYRLKNSGTWTGIFQGTLSGFGDYDVTVTTLAPNSRYKLTSLGSYPSRTAATGKSTRSLSALVLESKLNFTKAAFGGTSVAMSGQAIIDSYDSSKDLYNQNGNKYSNGDIGTNGDITASGQVYIYGDPSTGASGDFGNNPGDSGYFSGTPTHDNYVSLPAISVPSNLQTLSSQGSIDSTRTIRSGDYKFLDISLSGNNKLTIIGPVNIYLTGSTSISVSGRAKVEIDSSSIGPIKIYFDGDVDLAGQGIINATNLPYNLLLFGTNPASQNINLAGQDDLYCALYAPHSTLNLSGQGGFYGSFVGNTVSISGQGGVHYDEYLGTLDFGISEFTIEAWEDEQTPYLVNP